MIARLLLWLVGCLGLGLGLFVIAAALTPTIIVAAASNASLLTVSSENELLVTRTLAGLAAALPAVFGFGAALVDVVRWRRAPSSRRVWAVVGSCVATLVTRSAWQVLQYRAAMSEVGGPLPMLSVRETSPVAHAVGAVILVGVAAVTVCLVRRPR